MSAQFFEHLRLHLADLDSSRDTMDVFFLLNQLAWILMYRVYVFDAQLGTLLRRVEGPGGTTRLSPYEDSSENMFERNQFGKSDIQTRFLRTEVRADTCPVRADTCPATTLFST